MSGLLSSMRIPNISVISRACRRSLMASRQPTPSLNGNLESAYRWLCAAQDANSDDGVAGWYLTLKGWSASYPETTGYIIPTLLTYASVMPEGEAKERALRMADWQIEIQLPTGAVRSGVMTTKVGPAVFNTGQVLFGWIAALQATGDIKYADAAKRAAEWLIHVQDKDGAWRKNLSLLTSTKVQTYNVRTAWGLALAGRVLDEPAWIRAASRNCDWALTRQKENGWFENCEFYENEVPLLHTIGYVLEGLLGVGEIMGEQRFLDAVAPAVDSLMDAYEKQGKLCGRYNAKWQGTVSWRCLTGEAQIAVVLYRLSKLHTGDMRFAEMGKSLLEGIGRIQDTTGSFPQSNGGISGSQPFWRGYFPFSFISWGAKFYLDALLMELFGRDAHEVVWSEH